MTMGGIYACRWRELRPINFGGAAAAEPANGERGGDEEEGCVRGRGRGRGRDGAGRYEMVEMNGGVEGEAGGKSQEKAS